jgi:hypothetical protein
MRPEGNALSRSLLIGLSARTADARDDTQNNKGSRRLHCLNESGDDGCQKRIAHRLGGTTARHHAVPGQAWRGPARPFPTSTLVKRQDARHSPGASRRASLACCSTQSTPDNAGICRPNVMPGSPRRHSAVMCVTKRRLSPFKGLERGCRSSVEVLGTSNVALLAEGCTAKHDVHGVPPPPGP